MNLQNLAKSLVMGKPIKNLCSMCNEYTAEGHGFRGDMCRWCQRDMENADGPWGEENENVEV